MRPTRQQQFASWLLVALVSLLMWRVHEAFVGALAALVLLRPDLSSKEHTLALVARYRWLVITAGAYAVLASGIILWATLATDKTLGSALGTKSIIVLFWPLLILSCLYERQLFSGNK